MTLAERLLAFAQAVGADIKAAKDRANHTGTQLAATISDFAEAVDDRVAALLQVSGSLSKTYDDAGNLLTITSIGGGSDPWTRVGLAADVVNATVTFSTITGFTFTPPANTNFTIEGEILLVTAGTTNMPRIQASVGAGQAYWAVDIEWQSGASAKTYSEGQGTTAAGLISIPAGTAVVATPTPFLVKYCIKGRSGATPVAIAMQLAAESAATSAATAKAGSEFRYRVGP